MSILIRGMEMPKSCIACLLNFGEKRPEYGLTICCPYSDGVISWRDKAFDNGRLASCGIVPVPPHGRCIDADALKASLAFAEKTADWAVPALRAVLMVIDEMPTIIPVEEGET